MSLFRASVLAFVVVPWSVAVAQPATTSPADAQTTSPPASATSTPSATPPPTETATATPATPVAPAVTAAEVATTATPAATGDGTEATDDESSASELGRSGLLSDEQVLYEERYGYADLPSRTSPHEVRDHSYWSFGFAYRHSFLPRGLVELFVGQAPSGIDIPNYQFEIGRRRNGVDVIMALSYADYSFVGPFRGRNDTLAQTEILDSNLRTFAASATMLWSSNFSDVVALQYGFDAGLGMMFGDLVRTEAYPSQGGAHTHDGFAPCVGPTAPGTPGTAQTTDSFDPSRYAAPLDDVGAFCGAPNDTNPAGGYTETDGHKGEHYGIRARSMLQGGSVLFFSWRLAPRLSLRIKPIRQIVMRFDVGFDFGSGIFLGAGAHYGF